MNFIPNTDRDRREMMDSMGIASVGELFEDVPKDKIFRGKLGLPEPLSELELKRLMLRISEQNNYRVASFLGAGSYNHYIPSVVHHLASRSEFSTSYTPYQPEVSQGVLQALFEFQTYICELCGMEVTNASMYDGSTALAEAVVMAANITERGEFLVSRAVHPEYREVLRTYAGARDFRIIEVGFDNGVTSLDELQSSITDATAAVLIQSPNLFGAIEDLATIAEMAHDRGAILVTAVIEPTSLGLLKPPGALGADIVVGEGQSFGLPRSYGGPALGFMATKSQFVRRIPGRLVGMTVDSRGEPGFVLTLQAREQHIRRERATSNICTSEALCAIAATVYLAALGKNLRGLAELNLQKAHYAYERLLNSGCKAVFSAPFYNEFVVRCHDVPKVTRSLMERNIIGGLELSRFYPELEGCLLFCVTETNTREEIDKLVSVVESVA